MGILLGDRDPVGSTQPHPRQRRTTARRLPAERGRATGLSRSIHGLDAGHRGRRVERRRFRRREPQRPRRVLRRIRATAIGGARHDRAWSRREAGAAAQLPERGRWLCGCVGPPVRFHASPARAPLPGRKALFQSRLLDSRRPWRHATATQAGGRSVGEARRRPAAGRRARFPARGNGTVDVAAGAGAVEPHTGAGRPGVTRVGGVRSGGRGSGRGLHHRTRILGR